MGFLQPEVIRLIGCWFANFKQKSGKGLLQTEIFKDVKTSWSKPGFRKTWFKPLISVPSAVSSLTLRFMKLMN